MMLSVPMNDPIYKTLLECTKMRCKHTSIINKQHSIMLYTLPVHDSILEFGVLQSIETSFGS